MRRESFFEEWGIAQTAEIAEFLTYMIPTEPMIENARASVDIFKVEGAFPQDIHGYKATI